MRSEHTHTNSYTYANSDTYPHTYADSDAHPIELLQRRSMRPDDWRSMRL